MNINNIQDSKRENHRVNNPMHKDLKGKKITVPIDLNIGSEGRFVANVVIGTLETNHPGQTFLLTSEVLEAVHHSQICKLFDKVMHLLWTNGIQHESMLLFQQTRHLTW